MHRLYIQNPKYLVFYDFIKYMTKQAIYTDLITYFDETTFSMCKLAATL